MVDNAALKVLSKFCLNLDESINGIDITYDPRAVQALKQYTITGTSLTYYKSVRVLANLQLNNPLKTAFSKT